ncbi:MAG: hypothetical protein IT364_24640 [Candidatus Hydrogenedentes bacterium]|nr:hypothetical protein [Candidatus Hydrogenedentota bacterium]
MGQALGQISKLKTQISTLEREKAEAQDNYEGTCKTIVQMHAAAVGEVTGPKRGAVEDIEDLRAEAERLDKLVHGTQSSTAAEERMREISRLRAELAESSAEVERLRDTQIGPLAKVLLEEFGGPTQDESACEMAVRMLRHLRTRLAEPAQENGWLIEQKNADDRAEWWQGGLNHQWTTDSTQAIRFSRQSDALEIIRWMRDWMPADSSVFATEHVWG